MLQLHQSRAPLLLPPSSTWVVTHVIDTDSPLQPLLAALTQSAEGSPPEAPGDGAVDVEAGEGDGAWGGGDDSLPIAEEVALVFTGEDGARPGERIRAFHVYALSEAVAGGSAALLAAAALRSDAEDTSRQVPASVPRATADAAGEGRGVGTVRSPAWGGRGAAGAGVSRPQLSSTSRPVPPAAPASPAAGREEHCSLQPEGAPAQMPPGVLSPASLMHNLSTLDASHVYPPLAAAATAGAARGAVAGRAIN